MDEADRAQLSSDMHLAAALSRHRPRPDTPTALECEGCGEAIPEARRLAVPGCERCVDCQERLERGMR